MVQWICNNVMENLIWLINRATLKLSNNSIIFLLYDFILYRILYLTHECSENSVESRLLHSEKCIVFKNLVFNFVHYLSMGN